MNTNEIKEKILDQIKNHRINGANVGLTKELEVYHPEVLDDVADFIDQIIDLALESRNKEVVKYLKEILQACQEDVDFGATHQQMVSTRGQAKCLEIINLINK